MIKGLLSQWVAILNLKSSIFVFWVRSFIFGVLGVNRFMTGQIQLKAQTIQRQTPIHSQLYNEANLAWGAKLAIFLAHAVLFIVIAGATLDAVTNATTNEYLQNAIRLIGVNNFIVGILSIVITIWWFVDLFITSSAVRKQNLEKILKAIDEQA